MLAFIPARGGSRRLPGKNILPIGKRPMIAWTILAAQEAGCFTDICVSTDSEEIADVARQYDARAVERNAGLALNEVPVRTVIRAFLDENPVADDDFCLLMPNCPLRRGSDILETYERHKTTGADATMTVVEFGWTRPEWTLIQEPDSPMLKRSDGFNGAEVTPEARKRVLCPSGAVRWARTETFLSAAEYYALNLAGHVLPWHRGIDIDERSDYELAQCVHHSLEAGFEFAGDRTA